MSNLQKSILATLVYFDLFNFPLTLIEIHKNLWWGSQLVSLLDLEESLEKLTAYVETAEGFYFLKGRRNLVDLRKEKYLISEKKYRLSLKYINLISRIPFVKAVFLTSNLGFANAKKTSDIDLLIITKKNKIWTTRFIAATLMKFLNKRPKPKNEKDKICLSFYVSEASLNLEKLIYDYDIYFVYWLNNLLAVYDPEDFYQKIYQENNWLKDFLVNLRGLILLRSLSYGGQGEAKGGRADLSFTEKLFKKIQLKILGKKLKDQLQASNLNVIMNEQVLKMHTKDRREEIKKEWARKLRELLNL